MAFFGAKKFFINKNFWFLFQGQFISEMGNALFLLASTWYIISMVKKGHAGIYLAILYACKLIPCIFIGPISGVFIDRINRKLIIILVDIVNGILFLGLFFCVLYNLNILYLLFVAIFINSVLSSIFEPSIYSIIPNIVEKPSLIMALSMNKLGQQLSTIVAGVLTGFLYKQIGIAGFFIFNMLSFFISALSECFIQIPKRSFVYNEKTKKGIKGVIEDLFAGFRYIKNDNSIFLFLLFAVVLTSLLTPISVILIPILIKHYLYLGSREYGIFSAISSVGAIVGMLIISHFPTNPLKKLWIPFVLGLMGLSFASVFYGIPVMPFILTKLNFYFVFIIILFIGFFEKVFNSFTGSILRTIFTFRVADEFRGRFFSILAMTWSSTKPLSYVFMGILLMYFKPYILILAIGIMLLLACIFILSNKSIKGLFELKGSVD